MLAALGAGWNILTRMPETRREGETEWRACVKDTLDDLLYACSEVATARRGVMPEPWELAGVRMERRIVGVLARRRPERGDPDEVYIAVSTWVDRRLDRRLSLHVIIDKSGGANRYEGRGRAPSDVMESAKGALRDAGWTWDNARPEGGGSSRFLWCSPRSGRRVSLRPSTYIKRIK